MTHHHHGVVVYAFDGYETMSQAIADRFRFRQGSFALSRFSNGELHLSLVEPFPKGYSAFVIGSIAPPDISLFAISILCHTLRKEGAPHVHLFLPYLAYARHDKAEARNSQITDLMGALLQASGVSSLLAYDIHSKHVQEAFPFPVTSISPSTLFAHVLQTFTTEEITVVAPDRGARQRASDVASFMRPMPHMAFMTKKRSPDGVIHRALEGTLSEVAIVVDDILDTGKTLLSCCEELKLHGVKKIYIMVTHGLFTGSLWKGLFDLGVQKIYCTDTVPLKEELFSHKNIEVLSTEALTLSAFQQRINDMRS